MEETLFMKRVAEMARKAFKAATKKEKTGSNKGEHKERETRKKEILV